MNSAIPSRIGRYQIVNRLGAGGMGVVYLADDPLLGRTVAIKVLPSGDDEGLRERFLREARSVAALRHPNIVTIYDIGDEQGQLFIAMERIDGESMADAIGRSADYSLERKLQLMIELCAGLGYAHKRGIIHRDIKPGNLMISSDGQLKVLDFGLARLATSGIETGLTQSGALVGTPNYMSPEQVRGDTLDHRSDIFSVGLVLYEWLAYRRAFASESVHTLLHDIAYNDPTPLRTHVPSIGPRLAAIVDKTLQKDPATRYQSLDALEADLKRVLDPSTKPANDATVVFDAAETVTMESPAPVAITAITPPLAPPPARRLSIGAALAAVILVAAVSMYLYQTRGELPQTAAPQTQPSAQPTAPAPQPVPQSTAPPATATVTSQPVTIDVLPWARVRIVPVGHDAAVPSESLLTPFTVSLVPGEYRLECENDGLSPRTVLPVTVAAGKPSTITRQMQGFNPARVVDTLLGSKP